MATTETGLVNMALTQLGEDPIGDLTEDSKPGRFALSHYANVRDEVLRAHNWNSAMKRAALALDTLIPVFGYARQFVLPSDFIKLSFTDTPRERYRIEGLRILSDQQTLSIIYVYRLTNVAQMDPLLQDAIATKLAAEMAVPITGNRDMMRDLVALYDQKLAEARFQDSREGPLEQIQGSAWTDAWEGVSAEPYRPIESA